MYLVYCQTRSSRKVYGPMSKDRANQLFKMLFIVHSYKEFLMVFTEKAPTYEEAMEETYNTLPR